MLSGKKIVHDLTFEMLNFYDIQVVFDTAELLNNPFIIRK